MIRLLIIDDHPVVASGLANLLNQESDIDVVAVASDRQQALLHIRELEPDVIIQDLNLGDDNGVDVMQVILERWPNARVLIFTVQPEDSFALGLIEAGAAGFLNKSAPITDMVEAIRRVHRGKKYISHQLRYITVGGAMAGGLDSLSPRERDVFQRLAGGTRQVDICEELGVSHGTLSAYLARIHRKLGTNSVGELIRFAARNSVS